MARIVALDEHRALVADLSRGRRHHAALLSVSDLLVVAVALFAAQLVRFGVAPAPVSIPGLPTAGELLTHTSVSVLLVLGWALSLRLFGARDPEVIGSGLVEYNRVSTATFGLAALFAMIAFATQAEVDRAYLLVGFALGWALLLLSRWLWRRWLLRR